MIATSLIDLEVGMAILILTLKFKESILTWKTSLIPSPCSQNITQRWTPFAASTSHRLTFSQQVTSPGTGKTSKIKPMKIMLVGLGQEMHGDDEVGLEVVHRWIEEHPGGFSEAEVQTRILDSPGINLLGTIAGLDAAILVAAIRSGAPQGTILVLKDEKLAAFVESNRKEGGWGAAETLSLGRQLIPEELPGKLVLIGIEGSAFGLGEGLSPAVRAAIPQALTVLNRALAEIQGKDKPLRQIVTRMMDSLRKALAKR